MPCLSKFKSPADLDARRGGGRGARRGGGARGARGGGARGDRAPPPRRGGRGAPRGSTRPPRGRRVRSPDQPTELRKPGNRTVQCFLASLFYVLQRKEVK